MNRAHLLWFGGLLLTLAAALYCFHVHEERQRFVVLGNAFDSPDMVIMFDRKTHKSCLVALDLKTRRADLCDR
jgi:hypothetical protein